MFDIIVTSTTVQELEVDPAVCIPSSSEDSSMASQVSALISSQCKAVDFVHPESPPDFGDKQTRTFHQYKEGSRYSVI
jgi:hypothetical protein